jgi:mannose-6-phosphate isomerase
LNATPIRFEPVALTRVWGGRRMADRLGRDLPAGPIGESWDISARPEATTKALTGPRPGADPSALLGRPFPLLIKILDAADRLSVQVHPTAAAARTLPGAEAKHEVWVVLDAAPDAVIYRGFIDGVDRAAVEEALTDGGIAGLLRSFQPRPGDVFEIPPGTVHAIGAGCLLLEVQQASDTTFRLWDWDRMGLDGRPRALHVDEALASLDYDVPEPGNAQAPANVARWTLVDETVLRVERALVETGTVLALDDDRVHVVTNIGDGVLRLRGDTLPLVSGDSALLLPHSREVAISEGDSTSLLLTSVEVS